MLSDDESERLAGASGGPQRETLERIYARAKADMEWPLDAVGTGAAVTLKRVTCVRISLDGGTAAEIAAAAGMSVARVEALLRNVAADGLKALYLEHEEKLDFIGSRAEAGAGASEPLSEAAVWRVIEPIINEPPSKRGVHAPAWYPGLVAEFLVQQGTLEDASASQIKDLIARHRDQKDQSPTYSTEDLAHDKNEAKPWVQVVVLVVLLGILGLEWGKSLVGTLAVGLVTVLFVLILFKQGLEWLLVRKTVAPKVKDAARPANAPPPVVTRSVGLDAPASARKVPPEKVKILNVRSLPDVSLAMDEISDSVNAMGRPVLRVLYLWVFAAQQDQRGYETDGWPQLGPVHLLLNATALTINQLTKGGKLLIKDSETLNETIDAYTDEPGTLDRPSLFYSMDFGTKRIYKGYPIHTLVCADATWQEAFGRLAARCDLAVVNLSGYDPTHPGLEYEILHLLAGGPPKRFVFLFEPAVDADAVIDSVVGLWGKATVAAEEVPELVFVRVPDSQDVGYGFQFQKAMTGTGWIGDTLLAREGRYVPVASRIVKYLGV